MTSSLSNFLFLSVILLFLLSACQKETVVTTDTGAKLAFSLDTLFFDTVFTEAGSATRYFKVYNPNDNAVRISKVSIQGGVSSTFRMNVDGFDGFSAEEVFIPANDSIYVFVEAFIDPNSDLSPFVINDKVVFETNGNVQEVQLEAWGQNAIYFPNQTSTGLFTLISCDNGSVVWPNTLPYVIFGSVIIDSCTLIVEQGVRIYVHGGLASFVDEEQVTNFYNDGRIIVGSEGRIIINGTADQPVIMQSDRLESGFQEVPGQWYGIVIGAGSKGSEINYTTIKNAALGIGVDSAGQATIANAQMYNMAGSGIIGVHADLTVENTLVYGCAGPGVRLFYGGNYQFDYTTVASYGTDASALSLSNGLCLDPFCIDFKTGNLQASFTNSIFYGSLLDEISLTDFTEEDGDFTYSFNHCIVKVNELDDEPPYQSFLSDCINCINPDPLEPLFRNRSEDDFHLDSLSVAEEKALPLPQITIDLENNLRDPILPDIGCFEFIPQ